MSLAESARRIGVEPLASTRNKDLVHVALQLLAQHLMEFSDPYERTRAHAAAGSCHVLLNQPEQAFDHFRASLKANEQAPNIDCGVAVEFGWLAVCLRRSDLYDEALRLLPEDAGPFPISRFKAAAARAVIADAGGRVAEAVSNAHAALEAAAQTDSGFGYHQSVGLVGSGHEAMVRWLRLRVAA